MTTKEIPTYEELLAERERRLEKRRKYLAEWRAKPENKEKRRKYQAEWYAKQKKELAEFRKWKEQEIL